MSEFWYTYNQSTIMQSSFKAEAVQARFDTPNYELDKPLPKGKSKKVIRLMKDESVGKIMKTFAGLRAKTYLLTIRR